jgi:hypothetical protein
MPALTGVIYTLGQTGLETPSVDVWRPLLIPSYKFVVTKAYKQRLNLGNKEEVPLLAYVYRSTNEH